MKAMILAAGRGERMRPLTDSTPKALLPAGERRLIEYHLASLQAAGITDIVINVAWLRQQLMDYLGDGAERGLQIVYSDEGDSALETGGGIAKALPLLGDEPFWVVNGDVYTQYGFSAGPLTDNSLAHLLLVPNPTHNSAGDFALEGSSVVNTGNPMHTYSGIALMRPELFTRHQGGRSGAFPLAPLLRAAADGGQMTGELLNTVWIDVGTPERLQAAAAAAQQEA
jgi:MurNAc alpha-1-phosphate uridylyltransferase